jgi:ketosteroid isomerase-like protein
MRRHLRLGITGCALLGGCVAPRMPAALTAAASLRETAYAWTESFRTRNPETISSFYSDDVIAMYPAPTPTIGRSANRDAWARYYSQRSAHPVSIDSVVASNSGDLGYTFGKWLNAEIENPEARGGRYVAVWRRVGGEWRIILISAHMHPDVTPASFTPAN